MQENLLAVGALPRIPLGELAALPQTSSWLPSPQEPHPRSRPFGRLGLRPSHRTSVRNRRLGPSQHDGLDPPIIIMPVEMLSPAANVRRIYTICGGPSVSRAVLVACDWLSNVSCVVFARKTTTDCHWQGEATSHNLWPRYDRHAVGITWHDVWS